MPDEDQLLYLFSSNIRPLYEQDVLDLLSLPEGSLYRFRYFKRYVSADLWQDPRKAVDVRALIHFSIQDPSQYHDPAFIPVRLAKVVDTEKVGDVVVFALRLGAYCSLRPPADFRKAEERGPIVRKYSQALDGIPKPYVSSAGIGLPMPANAHLDARAGEAGAFESTVQFLQHTQSFKASRIYRICSLSKMVQNGSGREAIRPDKRGVFEIQGGSTYAISLHHFQTAEAEGKAGFRIDTDKDNLRIIGKPEFEITSRYDLIELQFHAVEPPTTEPRETVLSIEPQAGVRGPAAKLFIRVTRSPTKTATAVGGGALVALLLGIPGLWPALAQGWKATSVIAATVLSGWLVSAGLKRS